MWNERHTRTTDRPLEGRPRRDLPHLVPEGPAGKNFRSIRVGVRLFLVAPDAREEDVRQQLARPAFRRVADLSVRFLPYGELAVSRVV